MTCHMPCLHTTGPVGLSQLPLVNLQVQQELLCLRGQLLREPALDLDHKIRQLRQAVFKWQYKQRQVPCDDVDGPSAPTASSLYSFDAMS